MTREDRTGQDKRQLRAEAVERLREMGGDIPSARILKALYPLYNPFFGDDNLHMLRDALIDLLADDEPPEGDALEGLRLYADENRYDYDPLKDVFEVDERLPELCGHVADMVERDYVRREQWAEAVRAMKAAQDRMEQAREERDEWRDRAEQDGATRAMTNLERLYGSDGFFSRFARWYVVDGGMADDDIEADEWLMAEHAPDCGTEPAESVHQSDLTDTDCGQGTDMSGNAPGCARNDASASENGVSGNVDAPNDTREALEADVRRSLGFTVKDVFGWLDRQELITERRMAECYKETGARLVNDMNAARAERDALKDKVDLLTAERDECADAADAAERKLRQLDRGTRFLYGGPPE